MKVLLSPAKLMVETHYPELPHSLPLFLHKSETLVKRLRELSPAKLASLMKMSPALAKATRQRFIDWHLPFSTSNATQAILAFNGDVYRGLDARSMTPNDLRHAQDHLLILSGLYGILKPLDLIQPYRLMMGTPISAGTKQKNLYAYWTGDITEYVVRHSRKSEIILNLASDEYFKVIDTSKVSNRFVHCEFKELKNGKYVSLNTYVKQARGLMARYVVQNHCSSIADIKQFNLNGYRYLHGTGHSDPLVFGREQSYPARGF